MCVFINNFFLHQFYLLSTQSEMSNFSVIAAYWSGVLKSDGRQLFPLPGQPPVFTHQPKATNVTRLLNAGGKSPSGLIGTFPVFRLTYGNAKVNPVGSRSRRIQKIQKECDEKVFLIFCNQPSSISCAQLMCDTIPDKMLPIID